ncbi:MAG: hypothetical protein JWR05_3543 [Mucilaginibacter sp.]|nr:hypothetical protein [Mucilaginibacter sp.]
MKKSILTIALISITSFAFSQAKPPISDSVKISRQDYELFKSLIGPAYERIQEQSKAYMDKIGVLYQTHFKPDTTKKK